MEGEGEEEERFRDTVGLSGHKGGTQTRGGRESESLESNMNRNRW